MPDQQVYTHNQAPNLLNAEHICSNSRLSEFRINLFIDNFSSFHLSNNISSHFLRCFVSDQSTPNVYSASTFSCTFASSVCFGIDTRVDFYRRIAALCILAPNFCAQLCKNWHRLADFFCI